MRLRLRCLACGRNLADVTYNVNNPDATADSLTVTARPNVDQSHYRHPEPYLTPSPSLAGNPLSFIGGHTYVWRCRCGKTHERRHEWITQEWADAKSPRDTRYPIPIDLA